MLIRLAVGDLEPRCSSLTRSVDRRRSNERKVRLRFRSRDGRRRIDKFCAVEHFGRGLDGWRISSWWSWWRR